MRIPTKPTLILLLVTAIMAIGSMGCNTAHGFGQDMESAGDKIQEKTE